MKNKGADLVCILAAGRGTRLGRMGEYINKSLAPVAYKPVLSRIISKFSPSARFVIAVGHRESLVREFLSIVHPELRVEYVRVDNYDRQGSGPGYSLLCCKEHLQEAFVLTTCDTLVEEDIPDLDQNWVGVATHPHIDQYCSMTVDENSNVQQIHYKEDIPGNLAFIGLAGIRQTDEFWQALSSDRNLIFGEHQVANGLRGLIPNLRGKTFTWFDTGDTEGLAATNRHYEAGFSNFDKENEFLYFVNGSVIKFFADSQITALRVERNKVLGNICPPITASTEHFYRYPYVDGTNFAKSVDDISFGRFLSWCSTKLWLAHSLTIGEEKDFHSLCRRFYRDKTLSRLKQFHESTGIEDREEVVNGYKTPTLQAVLDRIDWDWLSSGIPVRFHGDLHFDNTVVPSNPSDGEFKLLDWRQDFCGSIKYGDLYYDLAKIHHELIIAHDQIKANAFEVIRGDGNVRFTYLTRSEYISCQKVMQRFVAAKGLDYRRVLLLTYLIFLNMSPLHHYPFNILLYYLGKLGLHQLVSENYEKL